MLVKSVGKLTTYTQTLYVTIICVAITSSFQTVECKYNQLQFGVRISSRGVSKQKLHISMPLYVYNKTSSKEIHPEATSFSRSKGFVVFPSKHWCLCSLPQQESFQKLQ